MKTLILASLAVAALSLDAAAIAKPGGATGLSCLQSLKDSDLTALKSKNVDLAQITKDEDATILCDTRRYVNDINDKGAAALSPRDVPKKYDSKYVAENEPDLDDVTIDILTATNSQKLAPPVKARKS